MIVNNASHSNNNEINVLPSAFLPRPEETTNGNSAISVNWCNYFENVSFCESLYLAAKSVPLEKKTKTIFAIGNVGEIKRFCSEGHGISVEIVHDPSRNNQSHSQIKFLKKDEKTIGALASSKVFSYLTFKELEQKSKRKLKEDEFFGDRQ